MAVHYPYHNHRLGKHYIIINRCFIHNAISLSQCRRLPYAFCTRPPTFMVSWLNPYRFFHNNNIKKCCSDWYLRKLVAPKPPSPRLEIRQIKEKKEMEMNYNLFLPFARETIPARHKDKATYSLISCLSIRPTLKAHHGTNPTEARLSRVQPLKPC